MEKPYFIMLWDQGRESARPIVDGNDEVVFWETEAIAREAMKGNMYVEAFGFSVFTMLNAEDKDANIPT